MGASEDMMTASGPSRSQLVDCARRWGPLVVLALIAILVWTQWHDYLTFQFLAQEREALAREVAENFLPALAAYAGIYILVVAVSLPGGAWLTLAGGFLFGWLIGGLVAVAAATVGASVIFLIARSSLGSVLAARAGPWLSRLREGFDRDAVGYLLFLRLVPAFPFWLVNIAPALLGMDLRRYVLATLFGIIPGTFAFAFLGAGLDGLIAERHEAYEACLRQFGGVASPDATGCSLSLDPAALLTTELIAAFVALGLIALVPMLVRRWRRR
jgi:uncharacterized membrane protein YdjX (TVP38/TMEM64 family)